jgi:AcrR family transcriptional regulator
MDLSPDKRERIIVAASQLIVRNGLQCSMSAIAEEAGVATGSLYNYFDSKEALVRGVYGRVAEVMTARLTVPLDRGITHEIRVRQYIERYIDFIWEDATRAKLFDYLDNNPLMSIGEAAGIFDAFVRSAAEMLADAQAAGVVRQGPITTMASFTRGAIRNTLKRRRMNPAPLAQEERSHLAQMCWDALSAR